MPATALPRAPRGRLRLEPVLAVLVVFAVALAARVIPTLRGGGFFGLQFYDDGVHYAAAVGLVNGRMPYQDFLLLHPPGILVLLAPFAGIGDLVGDPRGFALARLAFVVLGAVNAVLVSRFLRPVGVFAAWLGGLAYALFWPAIYSEHTVLLEGPGNTCLLVALLLLSTADRQSPPTTRRLLVAGGLLGFALSIKIWGVVPIVLLVGWLAIRYGFRPAWLFLAGAVATTTAVCLPFFLTAPFAMWRMVVVDQLQRTETDAIPFERLKEILGLTLFESDNRFSTPLLVALVVLAAAMVAASMLPRTRPAVLLLLGMGVMLMFTPSWFVHYSALTGAMIAVVLGALGQRLIDLPGLRGVAPLRVGLAGLLVLGLLAGSAPVATKGVGQRFPGQALHAAVANRPGCVTTDHPSTLILMNVLTRNLDRRCRLVVDLGGASYDLPSPQRGLASRRRNKVFQAYALRYLKSGDTAIVARFRRGYGLSSRSVDTYFTWPVLVRAGKYTLHVPPHSSRRR